MLEIDARAESDIHKKVITFCFLMYYWCAYKNLCKSDLVITMDKKE